MQEIEINELEQLVEFKLFLRDMRHFRLVESPENFNAIGLFLDDHPLPITADNLHCAFENLVSQGALELTPLPEPVVVAAEPQPETKHSPIPTAPDPRAPRAWRNGKPVELSSPRPL